MFTFTSYNWTHFLILAKSFWKDILKYFSLMYKFPIEPKPLLAIFETSPENIGLKVGICRVNTLTMLLARHLILLNWEKQSPNT